jgi:hypothetical protein
MGYPAGRFAPSQTGKTEQLIPLRLPAGLGLVAPPTPVTPTPVEPVKPVAPAQADVVVETMVGAGP